MEDGALIISSLETLVMKICASVALLIRILSRQYVLMFMLIIENHTSCKKANLFPCFAQGQGLPGWSLY